MELQKTAAGAGVLMRTKRIGKIARLPRVVRDELNRRLNDGENGNKILAWLNELPEVREILKSEFGGTPIGKQNLWAWRHGGYRDWVMREDTMELAQRFGEEAEEVAGSVAGREEVEDGPMPNGQGLAGVRDGLTPDGRSRKMQDGEDRVQGRRPMTEMMALWVTAQFGIASRHVVAARGKEHWRLLRQMVADVSRLRGGDHSLARMRLKERRLEVAREKVEFERLRRREGKEGPGRDEVKAKDGRGSFPSEAEAMAELLEACFGGGQRRPAEEASGSTAGVAGDAVKASQGESRSLFPSGAEEAVIDRQVGGAEGGTRGPGAAETVDDEVSRCETGGEMKIGQTSLRDDRGGRSLRGLKAPAMRMASLRDEPECHATASRRYGPRDENARAHGRGTQQFVTEASYGD